MNTKTKITLSANELELLTNTAWIFTKHSVIDKVYHLFGGVLALMKDHLLLHAEGLPEVYINSEPKISKGENYQLLPYVMLDYPRYFTKEAVLAVRTFFWWGNFFSVTLQLSGKYKKDFEPLLVKNFVWLAEHDYWICIQNDPWRHHFNADNYVLIKSLQQQEFTAVLNREPFIKIARKISISEWNNAAEFIVTVFAEITDMLQNQAPRR